MPMKFELIPAGPPCAGLYRNAIRPEPELGKASPEMVILHQSLSG